MMTSGGCRGGKGEQIGELTKGGRRRTTHLEEKEPDSEEGFPMREWGEESRVLFESFRRGASPSVDTQ